MRTLRMVREIQRDCGSSGGGAHDAEKATGEAVGGVAYAAAAEAALLGHQRNLQQYAIRHRALHPANILERRIEKLGSLRKHLRNLAAHGVSRNAEKLRRLETLLRTLGPDSAFKRGFSITLNEDGSILRSAKAAKSGQILRTKLIDGEITSTVSSQEPTA